MQHALSTYLGGKDKLLETLVVRQNINSAR